MSLIGKIFHDEEPNMDNHSFAALLRLWFAGETTRPQTITDIETLLTENNGGQAYTLTGGEKNQLDEFKAHYDGQPNANSKQDYVAILEGSMILAEHGSGVLLTKPKFKTINGLTTD